MSIATTKRDLLNSFVDKEYRAAFNEENVYTTICFQLRALREQRNMSQGALGKVVRPMMAQERISILEDPNAESKPTLNTLLRLADGLDVGLEVRFVPFGKVIDRATDTDMKNLEVLSFPDELPSLEKEITFCPTATVTANSGMITGSISNVCGTVSGFGTNDRSDVSNSASCLVDKIANTVEIGVGGTTMESHINGTISVVSGSVYMASSENVPMFAPPYSNVVYGAWAKHSPPTFRNYGDADDSSNAVMSTSTSSQAASSASQFPFDFSRSGLAFISAKTEEHTIGR